MTAKAIGDRAWCDGAIAQVDADFTRSADTHLLRVDVPGATDWRGNNNIAESIFAQMADEPFPIPAWLVVGAGTGGTSATLGRFVRYRRHATRVCIADPENSVFHEYWRAGDAGLTSRNGSRIEGIGRPRVEPSFMRHVIDRSIKVPDAWSFAAARFLESVLGRKVGPSTGTSLVACVQLIAENSPCPSSKLTARAGAARIRLRSQAGIAAWQSQLQAGNTPVDR